jgi:hypothetical protein
MAMPEALPDTSALARLAYELSLRSLTLQDASLTDLRARTGTLVAAASLVTSFLGGAAISRDGLDGWSVAALVAFAAVLVCSTWVLLPKSNLVFSLRGSRLYEDEVEADVFEIGETHRRLAYWLDGFHDSNDTKLRRLFAWYRAATATLLLEVIFWSVQLALS